MFKKGYKVRIVQSHYEEDDVNRIGHVSGISGQTVTVETLEVTHPREYHISQLEILCSRTECEEKGELLPTIKVWAKGFSRKLTQPAIGHLEMPICKKHAIDDPSYYVTDEGWEAIKSQFLHQGKAEPDRRSLRVEYRYLDSD